MGFKRVLDFFLKTIFSNGFDSILKVIWLSFLEYYHRDRFGKSSGWQTSTGVVLPIRMLPAFMILLNTFIHMLIWQIFTCMILETSYILHR